MNIEIRTLLVERPTACPNCGKEYTIGAILYKGEYRGDVFCPLCKEDYEQAITDEEGKDGRLLK